MDKTYKIKYFRIVYIIVSTFSFCLVNTLSADEVTDRLNVYLDNLDSYQANFIQTLIDERGEKLETSNGIVYLQKPGKFRWDYQEPYSQMIMTDGQTLWIYDEDLEQVTIRDVADSIDNTPAAILGGSKNIDEHFVSLEIDNTDGYYLVELTPKDIDSQYSSIRLGFDENELVMMVLFDSLGQVTRIEFKNAQHNSRFDSKLFTFNPPNGVDVIDDRG